MGMPEAYHLLPVRAVANVSHTSICRCLVDVIEGDWTTSHLNGLSCFEPAHESRPIEDGNQEVFLTPLKRPCVVHLVVVSCPLAPHWIDLSVKDFELIGIRDGLDKHVCSYLALHCESVSLLAGGQPPRSASSFRKEVSYMLKPASRKSCSYASAAFLWTSTMGANVCASIFIRKSLAA